MQYNIDGFESSLSGFSKWGLLVNIVICDDDALCRQTIANAIQHWAGSHSLDSAVVQHTFASTEDLLDAWENGLEMDMLFLDIQIPGEMSGLDLAKEIRKKDSQVCIAFTTNYSEYACEGYSVSALRYLRKPVRDDQVFECLDISYRQWSYAQGASIFIDSQKRKVVLPCKQILFIEIQGHYLSVHPIEAEPVQIRGNITSIAEKLPPQMFVQCHRSYIINLLYVRNITKSEMVLAGNIRIPIGIRYAEKVFEAVRLFYQGGVQA